MWGLNEWEEGEKRYLSERRILQKDPFRSVSNCLLWRFRSFGGLRFCHLCFRIFFFGGVDEEGSKFIIF